MGLFSIANCRIAGLAASVPKQVMHNADYDWISPEERGALIKATGVVSRRIASHDTTAVDLARHAAEQLLAALGWERSSVGLLVLVTQTADYLMPASSNILQHKLGLSKNCMAIDVNSGCSGYINGLAVAAGMVSAGSTGRALLLNAEIPSRNTSARDKSTYPLFGDAASATALVFDQHAKPMSFNIQSDGSGYDAIMIRDGGMRNPVTAETSFQLNHIAPGIERNNLQLALDGIKVFNFSMREVSANMRTLLNAGNEMQQPDFFVLHQANKLIIDSIRKKMGENADKFPVSIDRFGNTSSASIPLTMVTELSEVLKSTPCHLLLSGFGVGLAWGSCLVHTDQLIIPTLHEV